MLKPDFFIVGAPKCGTTSLQFYLSQHPNIFMPEEKELHFFGSDLHFRIPRLTEEAYLSYFQSAGTAFRTGEASVWYLYSRRAAQEIRAFVPNARILIMLRNPVDMMYSLHGQFLFHGEEDLEDFEAAFAAQEDRRRGRRLPETAVFPAGLLYGEVVRYTEQVMRYFNAFGRENVQVIIFDDLLRNTPAVYEDVLRFLEMEDFAPDFKRKNPNKEIRSTAFRGFLRNPPLPLQRVARTTLPEGVRLKIGSYLHHLNTRYGGRPSLPPDLRIRLQPKFAPEIERLSDLLRRDLTHWTHSTPEVPRS